MKNRMITQELARTRLTCPACGADKGVGPIVCWECFKYASDCLKNTDLPWSDWLNMKRQQHDLPVLTEEIVVKTREGWEGSGLKLTEYLKVGDVVDERMYYYFLEVLFPACMSNTCVQIGEAYSCVDSQMTFMTLKRKDKRHQWEYAGIMPTPEHEECLYHN